MKITDISAQVRDRDRLNIFIDGRYKLSLTISQVVDLGIKIGTEINSEDMQNLEAESAYGKVYSTALRYCLVRPRSVREVRDYLFRKTRPRRTKQGNVVEGVSVGVTERVLETLIEKKYINDRSFAEYWVEERQLRKGISARALRAELSKKGVSGTVIEEVMSLTQRSDGQELQKILNKKRSKYPDEAKLIRYLASKGFAYDEIKEAIHQFDEDGEASG